MKEIITAKMSGDNLSPRTYRRLHAVSEKLKYMEKGNKESTITVYKIPSRNGTDSPSSPRQQAGSKKGAKEFRRGSLTASLPDLTVTAPEEQSKVPEKPAYRHIESIEDELPVEPLPPGSSVFQQLMAEEDDFRVRCQSLAVEHEDIRRRAISKRAILRNKQNNNKDQRQKETKHTDHKRGDHKQTTQSPTDKSKHFHFNSDKPHHYTCDSGEVLNIAKIQAEFPEYIKLRQKAIKAKSLDVCEESSGSKTPDTLESSSSADISGQSTPKHVQWADLDNHSDSENTLSVPAVRKVRFYSESQAPTYSSGNVRVRKTGNRMVPFNPVSFQNNHGNKSPDVTSSPRLLRRQQDTSRRLRQTGSFDEDEVS